MHKDKLFTCFLCLFVFSYVISSAVYAADYRWYAGANKSSYSYRGIAASITAPSTVPTVDGNPNDFGAAWVSNIDSDGDWIQTGLTYEYGDSYFSTYVETVMNGIRDIQYIGIHLTNATIHYKVSYETSDGNWHAYIAGYDKGAVSINTNAVVQAQGEIFQKDNAIAYIKLGPFNFSNVVYKNSSNIWNWNDVTPCAYPPYNVSITDNANYKVFGP